MSISWCCNPYHALLNVHLCMLLMLFPIFQFWVMQLYISCASAWASIDCGEVARIAVYKDPEVEKTRCEIHACCHYDYLYTFDLCLNFWFWDSCIHLFFTVQKYLRCQFLVKLRDLQNWFNCLLDTKNITWNRLNRGIFNFIDHVMSCHSS